MVVWGWFGFFFFPPVTIALPQYGWARVGAVEMYLCNKPDEILMKHWAVLAAGAQLLCIFMYSGSAFAGNEPQTLVTFT